MEGILMDSDLHSILIVGINTRPVAKSAKSLGIRTIVVDGFGDLDLRNYADVSHCPEIWRYEGLGKKGRELMELSIDLLDVHEVDGIFFCSGTEHYPGLIEKMRGKVDVIGNKGSQLEKCMNKEKLFAIAEDLDIPTPRTRRATKLNEALEFSEETGYPVVLKPTYGGGGIGIRRANSSEEVRKNYKLVNSRGDGEGIYVQEMINGIDASASVISDGERARCLTVNEQIIGDSRLGAPRPYGYCGNVLPLDDGRITSKIVEYSEAICRVLGLVGSNGVDFVLADRPYLVEVNPRFQGTIDCVEGVLGINVVEEHIRACRGELGTYESADRYSVKLILYAREDLEAPTLEGLPVVDVPIPGSIVERGSPLCSVLMFGGNREKIVKGAYKTAGEIYKRCGK